MKRILPIYILSLLLLGCTADSYDTGDGRYSQMTADFVELWADAQKHGVSFVTDEGQHYNIATAVTASWITKGDSTYRATIYYNKVGESQASIVSCINMPTMRPKDATDFQRQPQDPVGLESCWVSKNGKYLNMGLLLKNGRDENGKEGTHALSVAVDETRQNADGTSTACYRLLHDQGSALEYYTNRRYVSILLPDGNRPDSIRLTVRTYDGDVVRTIKL